MMLVSVAVDAEAGTLTVATAKEDASDCGCKGDDADSEDESAADSEEGEEY